MSKRTQKLRWKEYRVFVVKYDFKKSARPQRQTDEWCRISSRPGSANCFRSAAEEGLYWKN